MIFFMAGLPRSGSSLLAELLSQHPDLKVTATNGLADLVACVRREWVGVDAFRAQGLEHLQTRIRDLVRGMITGFHPYAAADSFHVMDKSRLWLPLIELVEDALQRPVRLVCPVRRVSAITASFERLDRRHPWTAPNSQALCGAGSQRMADRARSLLAPDGVVGAACGRLLDAVDRGLGDRLVAVPFEALTSSPRTVCRDVFNLLGLRPFEVDPFETDRNCLREVDVWGVRLHDVHGPVCPRRDSDPYPGMGWLANEADAAFPRVARLASLEGACTISTV